MKTRHIGLFLLAGLTATTFALSQSTRWEIDPVHSNVGFSVRHMMITNVHGEFAKFQGGLEVKGEDAKTASLDVTIDAGSISTKEAQRDTHLKSADFFDVAKFPTVTFKSKKFEGSLKDGFKITGDLTMHGVTREIVLTTDPPTDEIKDPWGNVRRGVSGTAKLNRKDFGLTWNKTLEAGGVLVGEDVTILLDMSLIKKSPAAAAK